MTASLLITFAKFYKFINLKMEPLRPVRVRTRRDGQSFLLEGKLVKCEMRERHGL